MRQRFQSTDKAEARSLCKSFDTYCLAVYKLAQTLLFLGLEESARTSTKMTLLLGHCKIYIKKQQILISNFKLHFVQ